MSAWREARAFRTTWRMRYNMPPNDPRVLEADDELVLRDLLVIRYRDLLVKLAHDPEYATDQAAADGSLSQAMMRFKEQVANAAFLASNVRAIQGRKKSASLKPPQIQTVALRADEDQHE